MTSTAANNNVELLTCLVDADDEYESEYRFLVDRKHVKYATVDPGILPRNGRTFGPVLVGLLPPFPSGDWNEGHIAKDPLTERLVFSRYAKNDLAGIKNIWHQTQIDRIEFKKLDRLRQNIHRATHPIFDRSVIIKFAEFPWQIPYFESETAVYRWIDGKGLGPLFLGHLLEHGRVFGFILEDIEEATTAGPGDLSPCQDVLRKLHALGIRHGDINKYNFPVRKGEAVLVDFETSQRHCEQDELDAQYEDLERSLNDPSYRGGVGPAVTSENLPE